jgi:hypothetical protein
MVFMMIKTPKMVIPKRAAAPVPWANLISVSGGCPAGFCSARFQRAGSGSILLPVPVTTEQGCSVHPQARMPALHRSAAILAAGSGGILPPVNRIIPT